MVDHDTLHPSFKRTLFPVRVDILEYFKERFLENVFGFILILGITQAYRHHHRCIFAVKGALGTALSTNATLNYGIVNEHPTLTINQT
jgi:hypothetical protein